LHSQYLPLLIHMTNVSSGTVTRKLYQDLKEFSKILFLYHQ